MDLRRIIMSAQTPRFEGAPRSPSPAYPRVTIVTIGMIIGIGITLYTVLVLF